MEIKFQSRDKPTGKLWNIEVEGTYYCPKCGTKLIEVPFSNLHIPIATHSLNCPKCERKWILELVQMQEGFGGIEITRKRSRVYRTNEEYANVLGRR